MVYLPAVWPQRDLRGGLPQEPSRDGPPGGREHSAQLHRAIEQDMAITCAHTEHYIGTNCWGMDQAISFLAEPGKAKMIEFNPIRPSNVCLTAGTRFVISNCHFEATKAAFVMFNERVMECRLAALVISAKSGLVGDSKKYTCCPPCKMG